MGENAGKNEMTSMRVRYPGIKPLVKKFGKGIRERRLAQKLTQEDLGELAGIHYTFLGHIERGNKVPSLETLLRIAKALRVRPSTLVSPLD